jgi:hypothetical protein
MKMLKNVAENSKRMVFGMEKSIIVGPVFRERCSF